MNVVRSMLNERKVPKTFWSEAAKWCVHIQNPFPTTTIEDKTQEEAWSNEKPMVDYFRVFGCVAHVHIPDQNRSKLDDKSRRCVLLGVSDESKAWRLYDPISKKIIVSKDVVFEEEKGLDLGRSVEEIKQDILECEDEGDTVADQNEELGETSPNNLSGSPGIFNNSNISTSSSNKSSSLTTLPPNEPSSDDNELVEGRGMRVRREPIWMADYETREGLSDDENLNAMMTVTENDPTTFEEA